MKCAWNSGLYGDFWLFKPENYRRFDVAQIVIFRESCGNDWNPRENSKNHDYLVVSTNFETRTENDSTFINARYFGPGEKTLIVKSLTTSSGIKKKRLSQDKVQVTVHFGDQNCGAIVVHHLYKPRGKTQRSCAKQRHNFVVWKGRFLVRVSDKIIIRRVLHLMFNADVAVVVVVDDDDDDDHDERHIYLYIRTLCYSNL